MSREKKSLHFEIKAAGTTTNSQGQEVGIIEAFGAIYGNIDDGNDRVNAGASKRTILNSKQRAKSRDKDYILPMIWNHDTEHFLPLGGWYDVDGDNPEGLCGKAHVLLSTQAGREYYELAKAKMIDTFSVIYDIPSGGAHYDSKSGVREITEWRIFSIDPVIFPMNDETRLIGVKSMQYKSVCGDTSLPIGPRDESWDGSKAKKQIFDYAANSDGTINASKAKKCFLQIDGDATLKGSYGYPFCYVEGGSPRISVGGVKACAGALSGGRGAGTSGGDVDGMRKKVATMYNRINKKYPDDPQLSPPWEDDGKSMNRRQLKTLMEHYNEEQASDLCEDWQDVFVCSLTCAVWDAFTIGDSPQSDVSEALDAFKELVMSKFVPQAIECDLSGYLEENTANYSYSSAENTLHNGSSDGYGYMSRSTRMQRKAGRSISAANQSAIDDHVSNVHDIANQASKAMKASMKAIHDAADTFAEKMAGNQADSDDNNDQDEPDDKKSLALAIADLRSLRAVK